VGVEIESDWDREPVLAVKLERYRDAGVEEVVCFDPRPVPPTLRVWDLIEGDLVERDPSLPESRRCDALGLYWCIVPDAKIGYVLRLAEGPNGEVLLPTPEEAAMARVAELEAELSRRSPK
jgi:Uma2 family endonuclease